MATEDLFIIALELGSSNVTGVGGKKLPDGSIQIEAIAQEPSSEFIRNGMIFNMDKSAQCITSIISKLQEQLKRTVTQVYVGFGGQSIHSRLNSVTRHFDGQVPISKDTVEGLMKENINANIGDRDILEVVPQEYGVGTQKQIDPVGVLSDYIEGRFLNIIARSSMRSYIDSCFAKAGIHIVEDKLIPLTIAGEVLSDTEKRSGCVLVDFGADTTTVSVYKANLLRFLSVIPLGSANITKDIMSCQLEEKEAEELKLTYGDALSEITQEQGDVSIFTLPDGSTVKQKKLNEIVEARVEEILYNVKDQIAESGFGRESLVAGAWLIGGGTGLKNLAKAFTKITAFDKVKIVKTSRTTVHIDKGISKGIEGHLLGPISLLAKGTQICTSSQIQPKPITGIFEENGESGESAHVVLPPIPSVTEEPEKSARSGKKHPKDDEPKNRTSIIKKLGHAIKSISEKIAGEE